MCRVLVALSVLALLAVGLPAEAADPVNCDPEKGMVDLDRCTPPKPAYDPFADKKLTCWEMKRYPGLIFKDPDGPGYPSLIEIDWSCKENLTSLPFLRTLAALTKTIRSDDLSPCTGSIYRYWWYSYGWALLEAGFAPGRLLERRARLQALAAVDAQPTDTAVSEYFERWSYEALYNFDLYRTYKTEVGKATSLLARHYQRAFKYSEAEARSLATLAIDIYVRFATGSFPRDSVPETKRVLEIVRQVKGSLQDLRTLADGTPGEEDLRTVLNIALLLQRPPAYIALLVDRVGSLDYGDESALFFALRNHANVRLLLDRGATIDYQNGLGKTALFYAIGFNEHKLVELLLDRGAEINHRYTSVTKKHEFFDCTYGIKHTARTPLMHSAQHADVAMLELLLRRGANLHDVDGVGYHAAAYALLAERRPNSVHLKSVGLIPPPNLEREIKSSNLWQKCLDESSRRRLKAEALRRFFATCYQPEK